MKKIMILGMLTYLVGCSYFVSMDELARNIQVQMQDEFNSNQDYQHYRFSVKKVKIIQRKGNQFKAISHVNYQGKDYPVNVRIFKVNGGYTWSIEDDAFAFIDEIEIEQYRQQLDRELQQLSSALEDLDVGEDTENTLLGLQRPPAIESAFQYKADREEAIPVGNITAYTE